MCVKHQCKRQKKKKPKKSEQSITTRCSLIFLLCFGYCALSINYGTKKGDEYSFFFHSLHSHIFMNRVGAFLNN